MTDDQILDQPQAGGSQGEEYVQRKMAGNGKRFANFIIDTIASYVIAFCVGILFAFLSQDSALAETLMTFIIYALLILYPWIMESITGKTIGKYITRTTIVKPDGSKPESINILGRSLCRLIPFDHFSYLGGNPGWHDSIPKIYVIEDD